MLFRSDRKSTRLNSSHTLISYAVFCLKKKNKKSDGAYDTASSCPQSSTHIAGTSACFSLPPPPPHRFAPPCRCPEISVFFFLNNGAPPDFPPLPQPPLLRP